MSAAAPARPLLLFALANAGGVLAYLPLFTLLLPMKLEAFAPDARIGIVAMTTLAGAVAASLSNIGFGWWSDRARRRGVGRRRFIAVGLVATVAAYVLIGLATTPAAIVGAVVALQIAVNAMLGPFFATMAEEVPDEAKGLAGGLLALGNPLAAAVAAAAVSVAALGEGGRYAIVVAAMTACTLPLLLARSTVPPVAAEAERAARPPRDLVAAWTARLLVQIAGVVLFHYLFFYFRSVAADTPAPELAARIGRLMTLAYVLPLPVALLLGRLSDRTGRRKPFLIGAAALAAAALVAMATARDAPTAAVAFVAYAIGSSTFLVLQETFAMQLLPSARHRGRDMGLLNLTNTLPALIGPALAWALARPDDFSALMLALAGLTALGGIAVLGVRGRR